MGKRAELTLLAATNLVSVAPVDMLDIWKQRNAHFPNSTFNESALANCYSAHCIKYMRLRSAVSTELQGNRVQ